MRQKDACIPEKVLYSGITAQAVRLYCVLRRYADKDTWEAYPSRKTLAKRLNASDPKVADRATQELVAFGVLTEFQRWVDDEQNVYFRDEGGTRQTSNAYRLRRMDPALEAERGASSPWGKRRSRLGGGWLYRQPGGWR